MLWQPNIRSKGSQEQIFCDWRHKWVRLTPEEKVRQWFLHYLTEDLCYPKNLIAVEHPIEVGELKKRCDAVVMSNELQPLCIIEFKAGHVPLEQRVFDQVAVYNRRLGVKYLFISNGNETYAISVGNKGYTFLNQIPDYEQMKRKANKPGISTDTIIGSLSK
ncbi:MAG: type I restriction enzyme HsdR N-terminal domain-containing protein [Paludibacteraceae bacterium]|nr:type I restriction enzyme HsdR N-terminal domain-containing protein [Paludibacteraceae bacterium]